MPLTCQMLPKKEASLTSLQIPMFWTLPCCTVLQPAHHMVWSMIPNFVLKLVGFGQADMSKLQPNAADIFCSNICMIGVIKNSIAAAIHSYIGNVGRGTLFAVLQKCGALKCGLGLLRCSSIALCGIPQRENGIALAL